MTLQDAFTSYTARLHTAAMRPFLGWHVVNAANTNCRAPLSALAGGRASSRPAPQTLFDPIHAASHTAGDA
jgi:hypothetical protein